MARSWAGRSFVALVSSSLGLTISGAIASRADLGTLTWADASAASTKFCCHSFVDGATKGRSDSVMGWLTFTAGGDTRFRAAPYARGRSGRREGLPATGTGRRRSGHDPLRCGRVRSGRPMCADPLAAFSAGPPEGGTLRYVDWPCPGSGYRPEGTRPPGTRSSPFLTGHPRLKGRIGKSDRSSIVVRVLGGCAVRGTPSWMFTCRVGPFRFSRTVGSPLPGVPA